MPSAGVLPWAQSLICTMDAGEACLNHGTPSEFPGQLTDFGDFIAEDDNDLIKKYENVLKNFGMDLRQKSIIRVNLSRAYLFHNA